MLKNLYIITGASQGIGEALLTELSKNDKNLAFGVARTNPHDLPHFITHDLTEISGVNRIHDWLKLYKEEASSITLINNAGMIKPIGKMGSLDQNTIKRAIALNITAPTLLMDLFIKELKDFKGEKKILNISSGAARHPYEGWAVYCMTKAALDHITRVIHEEQKNAVYPTYVSSIAPGVIDTKMQATIRESSQDDFPNVGRFLELKATNKLDSPKEVALKLIKFLHTKKMRAMPVCDLRDFEEN